MLSATTAPNKAHLGGLVEKQSMFGGGGGWDISHKGRCRRNCSGGRTSVGPGSGEFWIGENVSLRVGRSRPGIGECRRAPSELAE